MTPLHLPIQAGPRRRTRRALLAAALPAVLAAVALPSAADAASVGGGAGSVRVLDRSFTGGAIEHNDVTVTAQGGFLVVTDKAGISIEQGGGTCFRFSPTEARCPVNGIADVQVNLTDGNDTLEYRARQRASVFLGPGTDTAVAGTRDGDGQALNRVDLSGGSGHDTVTYFKADRGVKVTPEDGLANDGRPGEIESVGPDFETFVGSSFNDAPLFGTPGADIMIGLGGVDQIAGGGSDDHFIASPGDGADDYHGGPGRDWIHYTNHTQPVNVQLDNVANDGASGEGDQVRSNVENILGGSGDDVLDSRGAFSRLEGNGGDDTLLGGFGPDTLIGGPGEDTLDAGSENDIVDARDGVGEVVVCGTGDDTAQLDSRDGHLGCENRPVGVLRVTPGTVEAGAGETARLRLSWRHPRAWKELRTIELRLTHDGMPAGEITIRPRRARIAADGSVTLLPRATRLTREGRAVTAHLALRLDPSLAGGTLTAEVEAVDVRGRRQLERDAGSIRIGR